MFQAVDFMVADSVMQLDTARALTCMAARAGVELSMDQFRDMPAR